jgi:Ca2+-transporting ATPase
LKPSPGTESDFEVENNKFAFSPGQLCKLLNPKSLAAFHALDGLNGLEKGLRTDCKSGLSVDEQLLDRYVTFEEATSPAGHQKSTDHPDFRRQATARTSPSSSSSAYQDRKRVFLDGHIPRATAHSIFWFARAEYNDVVLMLLTVAALTTIAVGLY